MIKSKTEEIISENNNRKDLYTYHCLNQGQNNQTQNNQNIEISDVNQKFEYYEKRMKSFESVLEEVLNFTKKTCKDIQDIQMNMTGQAVSSSKSSYDTFKNQAEDAPTFSEINSKYDYVKQE